MNSDESQSTRGPVTGHGLRQETGSYRSGGVWRLVVWLLFLAVSIVLPLVFLWNPPSPVGFRQTKLFGWGAFLWTSVGLLVLFINRTQQWRGSLRHKVLMLFGVVGAGAFGGAGGAALLDMSLVVNRYTAEVPVIRIVGELDEQEVEDISIVILEPINPAIHGHANARSILGPHVTEGDCLLVVVEQGWLGGAWTRAFKPQPCSLERGAASSYIVVTDEDFRSWRWHQAEELEMIDDRRAVDGGLPAGAVCRLQPAVPWLYQCES